MNSYYKKFKDSLLPELNQALIKACFDEDFEQIKYLLTSPDLKIHAQAQCDDGDINNKTFPLRQACFQGNLDIVKYLLTSPDLKEHANMHYENSDAFLVACIKGHLHIIKYLLTSPELHEHVNIDMVGGNPVSAACVHGHLEVLDYLLTSPELKIHANLNVWNDMPLKMACIAGNPNIVQYILNFPGYPTQKIVDFAFVELCTYGYGELAKSLFTSETIPYKPRIHSKKDLAFNKLLADQDSEMLRYFIFDLNIKKSCYIKKYLEEDSGSFSQQVNNWFNLREVNKQLTKNLKPIQTNNTKKNKI